MESIHKFLNNRVSPRSADERAKHNWGFNSQFDIRFPFFRCRRRAKQRYIEIAEKSRLPARVARREEGGGGRDRRIINDWLYSARKLHFARAFCSLLLDSCQRDTCARIRVPLQRVISLDCWSRVRFVAVFFFYQLSPPYQISCSAWTRNARRPRVLLRIHF